MSKCKHVEEFLQKPILEVIYRLSEDFICSRCNERITIDDIINEIKEK